MIIESRYFHSISLHIAEQVIPTLSIAKSGQRASKCIDLISNAGQLYHALIGADSGEA